MANIQDLIPRSRVNLRYRTMIEGELKEVELPFRLIIMADLSQGSSTDREIDLESRRLRTLDGRNLDALMDNMRMSISFQPKNVIDSGEDTLDVKLPIKARASFNPDQVAAQVPKIRALMLLRKLLLEMQAQVDNRKDVRNLVQQIFSDPAQLEELKKELAPYGSYHLPETKALTQPAAKAQ